MASQRGDYYQGLYLGKVDDDFGERVLINVSFPEKNATVNTIWWFDTCLSNEEHFFKSYFGTELKDITITCNGKMVSIIKPLREMFPLEFELTFEVKFFPKPKTLKKTVHFSDRAIKICELAHKNHMVKLFKKHHKI